MSSTTIDPVAVILEPPRETLGPASAPSKAKTSSQRLMGAAFPQMLLNVGFGLALLLAAGCLTLGAVYLYAFLKSTNAGIGDLVTNAGSHISDGVLVIAINGRLVMARIALLSCGVFAGMSFGFLGFALFLLGVKEEMNVEGQSERYSLKVARLTPGLFVIACAAILIGVCVNRETGFVYREEKISTDNSVTTDPHPSPTPSGSPDSEHQSNAEQSKPSGKRVGPGVTITTTQSAGDPRNEKPSPSG